MIPEQTPPSGSVQPTEARPEPRPEPHPAAGPGRAPESVVSGGSPAVSAGAKSVAERVFMVLLSFDPRHRAMTLSEISRRTGLPVATVHRLLRRLEDMGAVERDTDGRFGIGPLMWRMGILAPTHDVIGRGARPLLMSLSARTSSDVRVLSYFDEAAMCVDEILTVSMSADRGLGEMHPLHNSAGGIAIAAQLPPENRQKLRLTTTTFNQLEQRIAAAHQRNHVALEGGGTAELAVLLEVRDRPPMSISLRYQCPSASTGRGGTRLAALKETARSLTGILNDRKHS